MTPTPRPDVTALVDSLHALVRHAHDDHTVATEAADMLVDLARRLTEQDAATRADDARLRAAAARVWPDGLWYGCDTAEHLADEILTLRAQKAEQDAEIARLREEFDKVLIGAGELRMQLLAAEQALAAARRERDEAQAKLTERTQ